MAIGLTQRIVVALDSKSPPRFIDLMPIPERLAPGDGNASLRFGFPQFDQDSGMVTRKVVPDADEETRQMDPPSNSV